MTLGELDTTLFRTFKHMKPNRWDNKAREYDSGSFRDFKFASQNELFIYLDSPNVVLEPQDLIAFKPFGTGSLLKSPNYAYFHAREVAAAEMGSLTGKMIRVRNYATKEDGTLIGEDDQPREYSMDIKFRVDGGSAGMITMIIDPDTGNGAGNEP